MRRGREWASADQYYEVFVPVDSIRNSLLKKKFTFQKFTPLKLKKMIISIL